MTRSASEAGRSNGNTRLILVRHGQSVANVQHILQGQMHGELTEIGRRQIEALALHLRTFDVDHLISSDLRRARETAEAIAAQMKSELTVTSEVREWNIGSLDGEPPSAWHEAVRLAEAPEEVVTPEGGESLDDLRDRAQSFLDKTLDAHAGQSVMVVTHGDFIRACLRVLLGLSFEEAATYRPKNASYSILEQADSQPWQLLSFSIDNHLTSINSRS